MNAAIANQYSGTINAVNSGDSWTAYQDLTITADPNPTGNYGSAGSNTCLLYTSPSPRDLSTSRMPSSA